MSSHKIQLIHRVTVLAGALVLAACSGFEHRADRLAEKSGFTRQVLSGDRFTHVVYESLPSPGPLAVLHVYIEGDGTPWQGGRYPAADPTPRRPLALELMALDNTPAIYLGRPCYFGLADSANCHASLWTSRRYSPEVIASMSAVIRRYQQQFQVKQLVLMGYSGGGAIATLVLDELMGEVFLLTVAANLDTALWTRQHGYLPLEGSLNPVDNIGVRAHFPQLHLMGEADTTVPNDVTRSYTSKLAPGSSRLYPEFDHACCWGDIWESLLIEKPWTQD